jgi:hypothetical protein
VFPFGTGPPVTSTSVAGNVLPFNPFTSFKEVFCPFVSRKCIINDLPSASGRAVISIIFEGHPVINEPSLLLSPSPEPERMRVRNGTRQPHPNLDAKPFETSGEVVR